MNRHAIWRSVGRDYEQLKVIAPDGYEPVVEVFIAGRDTPVEIGFVETSRAADDPWIRLESQACNVGDRVEGVSHPDDYWVHVHEGFLGRIEIRYRTTDAKHPVGFSHRVAPDHPAAS